MSARFRILFIIVLMALLAACGQAPPVDELSQDEFEAALYQRITAVQANAGQVDGIVVLNEAMYQNLYNDRMGYDVTSDLFTAARAAFPDADLYINENPLADG